MRLNGEPLEEMECCEYLRSQVAVDGGCEQDVVHRMKEGYKTWGAVKSVLSRIKSVCVKEYLYQQRCMELGFWHRTRVEKC